MAKYNKKKRKSWATVCLVVVVLILAAVLAFELWYIARSTESPEETVGQTEQTVQTEIPETFEPTAPEQTEPTEQKPLVDLGNGLEIWEIHNYAGSYMEDGSNETVSGVMMLIVSNSSENDLQLADITLTYPDADYVFEVTNLPAGASAVLLERDRQSAPDGIPESTSVANLVFFQEPMSPHEDIFEISGMEGMLNVKNISDGDIDGDIYVYYKYSSSDLYYGGITFRAKVEGGLAAGEIRQISTGHYDPDSCTILAVTYTE